MPIEVHPLTPEEHLRVALRQALGLLRELDCPIANLEGRQTEIGLVVKACEAALDQAPRNDVVIGLPLEPLSAAMVERIARGPLKWS